MSCRSPWESLECDILFGNAVLDCDFSSLETLIVARGLAVTQFRLPPSFKRLYLKEDGCLCGGWGSSKIHELVAIDLKAGCLNEYCPRANHLIVVKSAVSPLVWRECIPLKDAFHARWRGGVF